MSKLTYLFIALVLPGACSHPASTNAEQSAIIYKTYHNQAYDYSVEYPDFLIPQGEATNQDGQTFLSEDQEIQLLVYRDYKSNFLEAGDIYSIGEAYEENLKSKEGVSNKKLGANHYLIEYKVDDILHFDYAMINGDNYFNIRFEYPEIEKNRMKDIIEHVINSLKVEVWDFDASEHEGNAAAGGSEDMFPAFIEGFLNDCYWEKNFSSLLKTNDKTLAKYIDPKMDVRRYHAPGTVTKLATRAENFGFTEYDDYDLKPMHDGEIILEYINDGGSPEDLIYTNSNVVYYVEMQQVPELLVNMETFETKPVKIAYPSAEIMAVYLPDRYLNPRGFYFINTPSGWKLAFVDDSFGGA